MSWNVGARVKVRDTTSEEWKPGTVTDVRGGKPVVKLDGQSRGFTWTYCEAPAEETGGASKADYAPGDAVRVRDSEKEDWKKGVVSEIRNGKPVVKLEGQSRGFTWTYIEPDKPTSTSSSATTAVTNSAYALGDAVRVRDSASEEWKPGVVSDLRDGAPIVKLHGQSRGFKWTFVEKGAAPGKADEPKPSGAPAVGDKVRVRDSEKEDWKVGTVSELKGGNPVVKLDGQSRGFTWTFWETTAPPPSGEKKPAATLPSVGETVRVRDTTKEDWKSGTVTDVRGDKLVVKLEGQSRGFTWTYWEADAKSAVGAEKKPTASSAPGVGDKVRVRDSEKEDWKAGTVTELKGDKPVVKLDGQSRGFTWTYCEAAEKGAAPPSSEKAGAPTLKEGDIVRVRDSEKEDWKAGVVTDMRGTKPVVKLDGQSRGFTWTYLESAGSDEAAKKEALLHKPTGGAPSQPTVGSRVRVRDSEKEDWKAGVVTEMKGDKPVVKLEGQSRGFTWTFCEAADATGTPAKKPAAGFSEGDVVNVRDSEKEEWKRGVVSEMRGDKPIVKLEGQSRGFTWAFVEPSGQAAHPPSKLPSVGDRVKVRESEKEDWKTGTVTDLKKDQPVVKLDGMSRGFPWTFWEPLGPLPPLPPAPAPRSSGTLAGYAVGDKVRVRDSEKEDWKAGTVAEVRGEKAVVKLDGQSRGFLWTFCERTDPGMPTPPVVAGGRLAAGARVRVRDTEKEDWKPGTVTEMRGEKPVVKLDGQSRGFVWTFYEALDPLGAKSDAAVDKEPAGFATGDAVRVRDTEKEDWKSGAVVEMRSGKPVVKLDGQSRGFTWTYCEADKKPAAPGGPAPPSAPKPGVSAGDKLRVRDSEKEDWKTGTVVEMRGAQPVVKLDGQSRGFTWTFWEATSAGGVPSKPAGELAPGDKVNVRDSAKEEWKAGTVVELRNGKPVVKLDGQSRGFTWTFCEAAGGKPAQAAERSPAGYSVGDTVRVRDTDKEDWKTGTVTELRSGKPVVKLDGQSRGFTWTHVEPPAGGGAAAMPPMPPPAAKPSGAPAPGDKVKVRDSEKEDWKTGTVTEMRGTKPVVKLDGQSRGFTWTFWEVDGKTPEPDKGRKAGLSAGDKARVRDSEKEDWKPGVVVEVRDGRPVVKLDGQSRGFTWTHCEPAGNAEPNENEGKAAAIKAASAPPTPTPPSSGVSPGDRVRVRDSEKEDWKPGSVTEMRGANPVVKLDGQSRGFTWTFWEKDGGGAPAGPSAGKYAVGDKVRVRDSEKEDWKPGVVLEMRGEKAVVKLDGQSRGFTWTHCEPASGSSAAVVPAPPAAARAGGVAVGDKLRVRDSEKEDWKTGTVTDLRAGKPVVTLDGQTRGFTWTFFEAPASSAAAGPSPPSASPPGKVRPGDKARVRDSEKEDWKSGTVVDMRGDKPVVKLDGQSRGFVWTYCEADPQDEKKPAPPAGEPKPAPGEPKPAPGEPKPAPGGRLAPGDRARVRDSEKEDWKTGTVVELRGDRPAVKLDGQTRAFTWTFAEPAGAEPRPPVAPSPPPAAASSREAVQPADFLTGDRVRVRDSEKEDWRLGAVTDVRNGKAIVALDGNTRGFQWTFVEIDKGGSAPRPSGTPSVKVGPGDKVRVRDSEKEPWKNAVVTDVHGSRVSAKREGQVNSFVWEIVEPFNWQPQASSDAYDATRAAQQEFSKQQAPEVVHKGAPPAAALREQAVEGLCVGATVRMCKQVNFRSGRTIQAGDFGVVTKVPGDSLGSPAQVRVADIVYSVDHGDIELSNPGATPYNAPLQPQDRVSPIPAPLSPLHPYAAFPHQGSPAFAATFARPTTPTLAPFPTPYQTYPTALQHAQAPTPYVTTPLAPYQTPPGAPIQPQLVSPQIQQLAHPVSPYVRRDRDTPGHHFHDLSFRAPEPRLPIPEFKPRPLPPPAPFQMRLTNERLNWQLLSAIDMQKLMSDIDVDLLETVMSNIVYAGISHEEAAALQPRHVQHLFTLNQLLVQYLLYTQTYTVQEKDAITAQAEDLHREAASLRELYEQQARDFKEVILKEKHLKKTLYAYELAMSRGGGHPQLDVAGSSARGKLRCGTCGRLFKKEAHLVSHARKRHNVDAVTAVAEARVEEGGGGGGAHNGDGRLHEMYQQLQRQMEQREREIAAAREKEAVEHGRLIQQLSKDLREWKQLAEGGVSKTGSKDGDIVKREEEILHKEEELARRIKEANERQQQKEKDESEAAKKRLEEENQRLRSLLSQKPQPLSYADSSDDEPPPGSVKVEELKRGDAVRILAPVHLGNEYVVAGETGVVQKVPGDNGAPAVVTVRNCSFNAPGRYFKKIRDAYAAGERVRFNKRIRLRSGKSIEPGDIGEVRRVPGDGGAVAEVLVKGIVYDAALEDVRRYAGLEKLKTKPTLASAAPPPAAAPAAAAAAPAASPAAAPSPAQPVGTSSPAAPSQKEAKASPAETKVSKAVVANKLLLVCGDGVPAQVAVYAGAFSPVDGRTTRGQPMWKSGGGAWLYHGPNRHWVLTDDEADFRLGKGWFYSKDATEDPPEAVKQWTLADSEAGKAPCISFRAWMPPVLEVETVPITIGSGIYRVQYDLVNGCTLYKCTEPTKPGTSETYLYSSLSGYWVITDDKTDFDGGRGYWNTAEPHQGKPPTAFKTWMANGEAKEVKVWERTDTGGGGAAGTALEVGQRVRVRDRKADEWLNGEVVDLPVGEAGAVTVRADGHEKAFSWAYVEALDKAPTAAPPAHASEKEKEMEKARLRAQNPARPPPHDNADDAPAPVYSDRVRLVTKSDALAPLSGIYRKSAAFNGKPVYAHEHCARWIYAGAGAAAGWIVSDEKSDFPAELGYLQSKEQAAASGPTQVTQWLLEGGTAEAGTAVLASEPPAVHTFSGHFDGVLQNVTLTVVGENLMWSNAGSEVPGRVEQLIFEHSSLKDPFDPARKRVRLNNPSDDLLRDIAEIGAVVGLRCTGFPPPEGFGPVMQAVHKSDKAGIDAARFAVGEKVLVRDDTNREWEKAVIDEISGGQVKACPASWDAAYVFNWIQRDTDAAASLPPKWTRKPKATATTTTTKPHPAAAAAAPSTMKPGRLGGNPPPAAVAPAGKSAPPAAAAAAAAPLKHAPAKAPAKSDAAAAAPPAAAAKAAPTTPASPAPTKSAAAAAPPAAKASSPASPAAAAPPAGPGKTAAAPAAKPTTPAKAAASPAPAAAAPDAKAKGSAAKKAPDSKGKKRAPSTSSSGSSNSSSSSSGSSNSSNSSSGSGSSYTSSSTGSSSSS
ncbi:hypothetical protein DIPPA_29000 [Diplonema papillatum]|nr:hypothetical protein DIPPA_29000 [Diplonema papillatum]